MATPMTAEQMLRQLKKWEVPFRETYGWRTRGRDAVTGIKFGPVYGFGIHHTGSDAPDTTNRSLIINGRSDLPGPLAHFGGNDDGVIDLISIGRANHFGGGDPKVLAAVRAENYDKYPPRTTKHQGSPGAVDGNDCFYGIECYYSGAREMTEKLYSSVILLGAAICDFHGWTSKSVIGHKEWSDWKPDPGSEDMHQIRLDIGEALRLGPPSKRGPQPNNVTEARKHLTAAINALNEVPEGRELVHDVRAKLRVQRARLPER